jgi:hypothetical protein
MILGIAALLMTILFLAGLHVASALGLIGMALMWLFSDRPLWDMLGQIAWNVNSSSVLVAIPLFVMMGRSSSTVALERLYQVLSHWLAPLPAASCTQHRLLRGVRGHLRVERGLRRDGGAVALPSFRAELQRATGDRKPGRRRHLDILIRPASR